MIYHEQQKQNLEFVLRETSMNVFATFSTTGTTMGTGTTSNEGGYFVL